ncbi:hypothetical protein [Denitrificimonas caeni]|uniref:hypothetical protein n=1 Tax=Denitrificimonas caeni TaxID=521720 RepID=UPI0003B5689D|nr:hypothetical protein [Denitrificimonas caeni]
MESFNAVHDLMEAHNLKSDQFGNLNFEAFVEYHSSAGSASEVTAVRIIRNGYQDGQISLEESGDLVAENYHLDFTTQYQKYSFSEVDNKLFVSGNSPKMGGKYNVAISPV